MDLSMLKNPQVLGGIIKVALATCGGGAIMTGNQLADVAGALAVIVVTIWSALTHHNSVPKKVAAKAVVKAAAADPAGKDASDIVAAAAAGKF